MSMSMSSAIRALLKRMEVGTGDLLGVVVQTMWHNRLVSLPVVGFVQDLSGAALTLYVPQGTWQYGFLVAGNGTPTITSIFLPSPNGHPSP